MLHNPLSALPRFPPLIVARPRDAACKTMCWLLRALVSRGARSRDLRDSIFPSHRGIKAIQVQLAAAAAAVTFNLVSGESNFPT